MHTLLLLLLTPAQAFDTGPHASATVDALTSLGFTRPAAEVVQVENWLTDYYTSSPTRPAGSQCDLEKLHFDSVLSAEDIGRMWTTLAANTAEAARQAEAHDDVLELLTVLGVSLHVVQDFYAHSDWVEQTATTGPYRTRSWFQVPQVPAGLHTGWYDNCLALPQTHHEPHGGYHWGMNHDSVVRPHFDRAYVHSLAASVEWTRNLMAWVDPAFAARARAWTPTTAEATQLARDVKASLYISEWVAKDAEPEAVDGHWNGDRSGYFKAWAPFTAGWVATPDSVFVTTFKQRRVYATLARDLYTAVERKAPPFKAHPVSGTVFAMRTTRVAANSTGGLFSPVPSYYGELVAKDLGNGGYPYRDAAQHHLPVTDTPWLQLMLVPPGKAEVELQYTLWDEWGTTNNERVAINGSSETLRFRCVVASATCTGDVEGGPWTAEAPFRTKGSGKEGAAVEFWFWGAVAEP